MAGGGASSREEASAAASPEFENWSEEFERGIVTGPADAPIKIIEFTDLQCPACARWSPTLDSLLIEYPATVQVSTHHFPIAAIHPFAMAAAVAAECADRQNSFRAFASIVYANQALMGVKSWHQFARDGGIPDVDAFEKCASQGPDAFPRIAYGLALAEKIGVRGTPSIWLNGVMVNPRPTLEQLRDLARGLAGNDTLNLPDSRQ
jgi:protein-disulfide isomerase